MSGSPRHSGARRLLATGIVFGIAATALIASPAAARPLEHELFSEAFSFTDTNFCDVGISVDIEGVREVHFLFNSRQPGTPPFGQVNFTVDVVYASENGVVTEHVRGIEKDLKITDNEDGTLTILVLSTGNATLYDETGKAIGRNPGQVRFELLIDHNGTVADPSDDVFLEFLGQVKGSTGRNDDFCEAVLPILG
ncbi:hypothetical protein [Agromyces neolithicus]|uniref:Uncharacterized protein n=1 Tax=Agromyces neolithicus TaxID=269420 RepID=A0ABN2M060_9MICO